MKDRLLTFNNKCVASVVSALKARHHVSLISEQVDYLALAFITPLGTEHYDRFCHDASGFLLSN
jgi:hypothetical protein